MVHRTSTAEVLLDDVRPRGTGFEAAASWPRSHPTFPHDGGSLHSPLVLVETLRQLGIYIPLSYFRVSPASHLVVTDLYFDIDPATEPQADYGGTDITCRIGVPAVRRSSSGAVTGLRLAVDFLTAGSVFARAGGGMRLLDEGRYAAVRGSGIRVADRFPDVGAAPEGLIRPEAAQLAVAGPRDVLIGLRGEAAVLAPVDPRHPFFFDHASDHVPGMVLLEAARQAAAVASGGVLLRPTAGRLNAERFTEFAPPARLVCLPHHRTCGFGIRQGQTRTAFGVLSYT